MVEIWSYFLDFSSESTCPWGAKQGMVATLSTRGGEAPSFLQLEEPWKGDQLPSPTVSLKYAPPMPAAPFFFFEPCVFPPFVGWRRCSLPLIPLLRPFLFAFFLIFQQQEKVPLLLILQGVCMGWDAEKWVWHRQNKWQKVMKLSVEFYFVQLAAFAWILPPPLLCRADWNLELHGV